MKKTIWILDDGRTGSVNQNRGIAQTFPQNEFEIIEKPLEFTDKIKFSSFLLKFLSLPLTYTCKNSLIADIRAHRPDIILSSGRRGAFISMWLKAEIKRFGKKTPFLFQINNPNLSFSKFDLIALFQHDSTKKSRHNLIYLDTAPNKNFKANMLKDKAKWDKIFVNKENNLKPPFIALIVGGSTKTNEFTDEMASEISRRANEIAMATGTSLLITTSRRTGAAQEKIIKENITVQNYFYGWGDKRENPILGYYACAQLFIITGESVSMCSESLVSGKEIFLYDRPDFLSKKHRKFVNNFKQKGLGESLFDADITEIKDYIKTAKPAAFDESKNQAFFCRDEILKRL